MKQLYNTGISGIISSSLPVLPISLEEKYPKLLDSQQVTMERELRSDLGAPLHTPYVKNNGVVEPLFSSASGFSLDVHCTSVPPYERQPVPASYISQPSSSTSSLSSTYSSYSGTCQPSTSNYPKESAEIIWCSDSLQGVLDYSDNLNTVNDQIQSNCVMMSDDLIKQNEWPDLTDLMNGDWGGFLDNGDATEPQPMASDLHVRRGYFI